MIRKIRKSKYTKALALYVALNMVGEITFPTSAFALTGGPSQPEVQSFQPVGMSEMVDLFSGDFSYNIPLMDVGGYPLNLIYNGGITMDQEASWVGLGWNINPGVITRNMRGIPDDFSGDLIDKEFNMEPQRMAGLTYSLGGLEIFGWQNNSIGLSYSLGINYSNYDGVGFEQSLTPTFTSNKSGDDPNTYNLGINITSSKDGLSISPNFSFSAKINKTERQQNSLELGGGVGVKFNSRAGLKALSVHSSGEDYEKQKERNKKEGFFLHGTNGGSSISLIANTYVPQIDLPRLNTTISMSVKTGAAFLGSHATQNFSGYYSQTKLMEESKSVRAFGYMYSQVGQTDKTAMHDFNREKDGGYTRATKYLPVTNHTYDVYSIAGQGIGGMFRPHRNDIGYLYDAYVHNPAVSGSFGFEFGIGNTAHVGADIGLTLTTTKSGVWDGAFNKHRDLTYFTYSGEGNDYEAFYFKQAGEKTPEKDDTGINGFNNKVGNYEPVRVDISKGPGYQTTAETTLVPKYSGNTTPLTNKFTGGGREIRNQPVAYLRKEDVPKFGVDGYIAPDALNHHIGEYIVYRPDGARYVYGIPAYNTLQKEVTFNISGVSGDCSTGLVAYNNDDASTDNERGRDHFYSAVTTPPYAHSYLLSSVLSADYSDVDGIRGPSKNDLGSYTRFNYDANPSVSGVQPTYPNYNWRTPYKANKANYDKGMRSEQSDDKASFIYGQKELWYIKTIETKTHVAVFHTSSRRDAFEAAGEHGGIGSRSMLKLDSISLYSAPDYNVNGNNATLIKRAHFRYNYDLCPGVDNNDQQNVDEFGNILPGGDPAGNINSLKGKLTLKKVFFTYQKSYLGRLSPYEFTYADRNHDQAMDCNFSYNIKGYDRWGFYQPNNGAGSCNLLGSENLGAPECPYTTQNQTNADIYASAWSLSGIKLPSGGVIEIDLEADDYGYVQDQQAMNMVKISGAGNDKDNDSPTGATDLFESANPQNYCKYLYFSIPSSMTDQQVKDEYVKDLCQCNGNPGKPVYFRFLMGLKGNVTDENEADWVSGYFYVVSAGKMPNYSHGYLEVKPVGEGDDDDNNADCHPVSKAAWNYGRLYNQRLMYGQPDPSNGTTAMDILQGLANASIINGIIQLFQGPNGVFRNNLWGKKFKEDKSLVRLYAPFKKKLGGGSRVKEIRIYDQWDKMNVDGSGNPYYAGDGFYYGQTYTYTNSDGTSSGVASYEPALGGEENSLKNPEFMTTRHILAPDERNYVETPIGESFFPSPSVGYSRVSVKNLDRTNVTRHATGHTVNEFYTAKDYPTITDQTTLYSIEQKSSLLGNILNVYVRDFMTASQGYVVELNDMHGKPRAQWVYAEDQTAPISGVEYKYADRMNVSQYSSLNSVYPNLNHNVYQNRLHNVVPLVKNNGTVEEKEVGVEMDVVNDFRQFVSRTHSLSANTNLSSFLAAIFPAVVPTIWPVYNSQNTRFRSAVTTKVINRYGILRETIAYDLGSKVSTENLAWDAETGEVLVTRTKNNFDDPIYNVTYPSHWAYDRMGPAYKNLGVSVQTTIDATSRVAGMNPCYFSLGDEVKIYNKVYGIEWLVGKAWVWDSDDDAGNGFMLVKHDGSEYTTTGLTNVYLRVIRSGRRNMQTTPIGTVTCFNNPLIDNNSDGMYDDFVMDFNKKLLNASMMEYDEKWQTYCNEYEVNNDSACVCTTNYNLINQWNGVFNYLISTNQLCDNTGIIPPYYFSNIMEECPDVETCASHSQFLGIDWNPMSSACTTTTLSLFPVNTTITFSPPCTPNPSCLWNDCQYEFILLDTNLQPLSGNLPYSLTWANVQSISLQEVFPSSCPTTNIHHALGTITFSNGTNTVTYNLKFGNYGSSDCLDFGTCNKTFACKTNIVGKVINPYTSNIRGVWRPKRSHLFQAGRDQTYNLGNTNIRKDGAFTSYSNFWNEPVSGNIWTKNATNWTWTSEVAKFSPFGFELENKDALNIYSAAIYGYRHTLPKAVASNSMGNQIGFDGFEDYSFLPQNTCCDGVFDFRSYNNMLSTSAAHSGRYSMKLTGGGANSISITRNLITSACTPVADDAPYTVKPCDVIPPFGPHTYMTSNMEYIVVYWVKQENPNNTPLFDIPNALCSLFVNTYRPFTSVTKSDLIDGWQRVECRFTINTGESGTIRLDWINNAGAGMNIFVDDIRVQPFLSSMKSFVYDPLTLRLWAELDERNFATFYEYDEEGSLLRVKKETEKGIMTIQESRNNFKK